MLSPQELTSQIKAQALALGFDKVGIIPAESWLNAEGERLQQWLALGYQAEMQWMVTHLDKRLEPSSLMEGTRSIVCVAMNYYTQDVYDTMASDSLKIAKYARGTDYHTVLKDRLKALLTYVQSLSPSVQGRALTDSAPIMEKPLAVKAGLGWMGKHGNLITPELGSWVFLGELLLDIELEYDTTTVPDHCGRCRRCIDACPTGAILEDADTAQNDDISPPRKVHGLVDANRCISYWTIEYKGETFPEPIQHNLNGWIFGCDICQDVCPWNIKLARPTREEAFQPRPLNIRPDAETLLALDEDSFREHYRKSPVKRTKLSGLRRNIQQAARHPGA
jgi:epoxyqueuosine reductase